MIALQIILEVISKMADESLVLCDCLCFIVNKYGKISARTMKSVLMDFYTAEELSTAKFQLCNDIDKLDSTLKRPHIDQRRDTDIQARITKEVDDIFMLFTLVDENKFLDKLPRYVAISPDRMPSLRLYDGDMNVLLNLLHAMEKRLSELESGLFAITRDVYSCHQAGVGGPSDWPHLSTRPPAVSVATTVCDINKSDKTRQGATVGRSLAVTSGPTHGNSAPAVQTGVASETETTQATSSAVPEWATLASTPLLRDNRYAVLQSTDDEERRGNHSEEPFEVVRSRRHKRTRQRTSPQQQQQQQQQSSAAQGKPSRAPTLFGKKVSSGDGNSNLKAAKKIRKKAVYCVDNIATSCSVDDLRSFVSELRIEVYSCFEVKPRRRRNEENAGERKAFRLCIPNDDRDKLLNAANWPDSVTVSEWYFRQANEESDKRRRVATNSVEEASVSGKLPSLLSGSNGQSAAAVASAAVVAAINTSADDSADAMDVPANENSMMNSDDTILAACNFNDGC